MSRGCCLQVSNPSLDDGISGAIGELVPAIHGAHGYLGELVLHLLNQAQKLLSRKTLAVKDFRADSDCADNVFIAGHRLFQSIEVVVEGISVVGPSRMYGLATR